MGRLPVPAAGLHGLSPLVLRDALQLHSGAGPRRLASLQHRTALPHTQVRHQTTSKTPCTLNRSPHLLVRQRDITGRKQLLAAIKLYCALFSLLKLGCTDIKILANTQAPCGSLKSLEFSLKGSCDASSSWSFSSECYKLFLHI